MHRQADEGTSARRHASHDVLERRVLARGNGSEVEEQGSALHAAHEVWEVSEDERLAATALAGEAID